MKLWNKTLEMKYTADQSFIIVVAKYTYFLTEALCIKNW